MITRAFQTSDVHLVAYLVTLGYQLGHLDGPKDERVFHFSNIPSELVATFYQSGEAPARKLLATYKRIRKMMAMTA